ncbi:SET domain-containing protein SmydA-8-like [Bradysia coprophila]|uniref:SET domain-containing protein SmydA-8-like n=1 Tax=Bradysia coprophila TaxID=38358 RepID=UPI00187DC6A5|nr:SET domain-containing protein SmydA-8-like [Bradysia coprophila]
MLQLYEIENLLQCHLLTENLASTEQNQLWTLEYSKLGGRGLCAKRNIKKGEVIFIDKPLLRGPRRYNKYLPMCANCYKSKSTLFPCDNGCGLPVCSDQCESSTTHVNRECKYLRNLQPTCGTMWSLDLLKVVIPIQSLTLCKYQKDLIGCLQYHQGPRIDCDEIELLERNVSNKIEKCEKDFMKRLCRVLDANAFETAVPTDGSLTSLRGLYPLAAFLNHCCVPNARHYFNKDGLMTIKAAVSIEKGEEITLTYTDFFWPTSLRWKYLTMTKNFECACTRCSDPTELGSNLSFLKCINTECCGNSCGPQNPLDSETRWTCWDCKETISMQQANAVRWKVKSLVNEVLGQSPEEIVQFIENELIHLVPVRNYITLDMKFHVVSFFGRIDDLRWQDLTDEQLHYKAKYCNDLISTLDQLTCGDSQKKALILYELYCTKREQLQRKLIKQRKSLYERITYDDLNKIMSEVRTILSDDIAAPDNISTHEDITSQF